MNAYLNLNWKAITETFILLKANAKRFNQNITYQPAPPSLVLWLHQTVASGESPISARWGRCCLITLTTDFYNLGKKQKTKTFFIMQVLKTIIATEENMILIS